MRFSDEAMLRLLVAVALGALVGAERETGQQPAGLRTHIAVCLGACLFGIVSTLGFSEYEAVRASTNIQIDVTRVASQVVVGIGFLGAGIIFRQGTVVRNLTTAASLWVTSAIGLTAGVGDLGTATVASLIMVVALVALRPLRNWLRTRIAREEREVRLLLAPGADPGPLIAALHDLPGVEIGRMAVQKDSGAYCLLTTVKGDTNVDVDERLGTVARRDDVVTLAEVTGGE